MHVLCPLPNVCVVRSMEGLSKKLTFSDALYKASYLRLKCFRKSWSTKSHMVCVCLRECNSGCLVPGCICWKLLSKGSVWRRTAHHQSRVWETIWDPQAHGGWGWLSRSVVSDSLWSHRLQPARLLCPWDSPGKNTGVGCHFLLQGIFPMQGSNLSLLHLLHRQADSLPLVPPGKPSAMEYGANKVLLNLLTGAAAHVHFYIGSPDNTILFFCGKEVMTRLKQRFLLAAKNDRADYWLGHWLRKASCGKFHFDSFFKRLQETLWVNRGLQEGGHLVVEPVL